MYANKSTTHNMSTYYYDSNYMYVNIQTNMHGTTKTIINNMTGEAMMMPAMMADDESQINVLVLVLLLVFSRYINMNYYYYIVMSVQNYKMFINFIKYLNRCLVFLLNKLECVVAFNIALFAPL